ncbi:hypothetical protein ACQPW1_39250 [Nocardia sp. CA-128927]|uniref:hypothetical protein n=1 Tax=Nocardia sp. CA-128927 TaxID=3239975 RepID=UPI003D99B6DF
MSYDLAFWEGKRPADDIAALEEYIKLSERYLESGGGDLPPAPNVSAYVEALLQRWPDHDDKGGLGPWAASGAGQASGPVFLMHILRGCEDQISTQAIELADECGLICYDPQQGRLRR